MVWRGFGLESVELWFELALVEGRLSIRHQKRKEQTLVVTLVLNSLQICAFTHIPVVHPKYGGEANDLRAKYRQVVCYQSI